MLELPNKMGWNALHWAAHGGRPGVLALLLRTALDTGLRDAVLGQRNAYGRQPVHIAANLAGPSAKPAGTPLEQLAGRDRWRASTAQWLREN